MRRVKVKLCGLTTVECVETAVRAGADAIGFVFFDGSPRRIDLERARALAALLPPSVTKVAVFHHPDPEDVRRVVAGLRPHVVQSEPDPAILDSLAPGIGFLPVFHDGPDVVSAVTGYLGNRRLPVLLEAAGRGGRGVAPNWERAGEIARMTRLVLAGGLTPENVSDAIRHVRPYAVDVSSGIERSPAVKDPGKIVRFIQAVRNASATPDPAPPDSLPELTDLIAGRLPDANGRFGPFGGRFAPETLMTAIHRLERMAREALDDPGFQRELGSELATWAGRPTAMTEARRLGESWGSRVFLKREDLTHTGAHKINNAVGQALLARRLGARRVVAETGAGQHGVAAAAACARIGIPCTVYMGAIDAERQAPNVDRMLRLGATVIPVTSGDQTLRAAIDDAIRDWVSDPEGTYYLLGSAVGPHPYPWLVREFQSVIGREARSQMLDRCGRLPDLVIACVGGGSNAIGLFHPFLADQGVELLGVEAGGSGTGLGQHAATVARGRPGVLHGSFSLLLQDEAGQVQETHSISAGLDYPGVGPEHAFLRSIGRVRYMTASDDEALAAVDECCAREGILPALESAHAIAGARRWAALHPGGVVLIGLSGRGDKDLATLARNRPRERGGESS